MFYSNLVDVKLKISDENRIVHNMYIMIWHYVIMIDKGLYIFTNNMYLTVLFKFFLDFLRQQKYKASWCTIF